MNHLAHFRLANGFEPLIVGAFLGDHVKGRLVGKLPAEIEVGIQLHRKIDAYADRNDITRRSYERLDPRFRRFAPILTDIFYDHFLAKNWQQFHDCELRDFESGVFQVIESWQAQVPDNLAEVASRMKSAHTLQGYADEKFIPRALVHLSRRLSRDNPLSLGYGEFVKVRDGLEADFLEFFPEILCFCNKWIERRRASHSF